jgi:hypothetical protein
MALRRVTIRRNFETNLVEYLGSNFASSLVCCAVMKIPVVRTTSVSRMTKPIERGVELAMAQQAAWLRRIPIPAWKFLKEFAASHAGTSNRLH